MQVTTTITPWLTFADCGAAVAFYKKAFGAIETYRLEMPGGDLVVKLTIDGAGFWLASGKQDVDSDVGGGTVRMILTTSDPEAMFKKAVEAGATEIYPVATAHGWRLGRVADPFGLHWEIGHPVDA